MKSIIGVEATELEVLSQSCKVAIIRYFELIGSEGCNWQLPCAALTVTHHCEKGVSVASIHQFLMPFGALHMQTSNCKHRTQNASIPE